MLLTIIKIILGIFYGKKKQMSLKSSGNVIDKKLVKNYFPTLSNNNREVDFFSGFFSLPTASR